MTSPLLTVRQVLDRLADRGVCIVPSTWRSYVARGQAPAPAQRVGREPLWSPEQIDGWPGPRKRP